jgi:hypothetical protein
MMRFLVSPGSLFGSEPGMGGAVDHPFKPVLLKRSLVLVELAPENIVHLARPGNTAESFSKF